VTVSIKNDEPHFDVKKKATRVSRAASPSGAKVA